MLTLLLVLLHQPAAAADALQPFAATLQGSVLGLGAPCVIREAPPHGAWTLVYEVTEPMQSGLSLGQQLCEIVHSPSMHLRGVDTTAPLACQVVVGSEPPRFACDGTPPHADMAVFLREVTPPVAVPIAAPADEAPGRRGRRGRRR